MWRKEEGACSAKVTRLPIVMPRCLSPPSTREKCPGHRRLGSMGYGPDCLGMLRKLAGIEIICCRIDVEWQHKKEHTALSRPTLNAKLSAMSFPTFPSDTKPQPHPS